MNWKHGVTGKDLGFIRSDVILVLMGESDVQLMDSELIVGHSALDCCGAEMMEMSDGDIKLESRSLNKMGEGLSIVDDLTVVSGRRVSS